MNPKPVAKLYVLPVSDSHVPSWKLPFARMSTAELLDEFDEVVFHATRGDRDAIGALAIGFTPKLLAEANEVLDNEHDAADVVQDLFLALLEGKTRRFAPERGRAIPYLLGVVRAEARKRRRERRLL